MATQIKSPNTPEVTEYTEVRDRNADFWNKNSKYIVYGFAAIVLVIGGFLAYKNFIQLPKEKKAADAMWKAEDYYRIDSARLALNGDGSNPGFLKIISSYGGTKAANLAHFYAGSSFLKIGDFNNAIKHLKDFNTDDKLLAVRSAGLLGDAYAENGNKKDAVEQYRKAGTIFPEDNYNSPEYLFRAGLLYQDLGNNDKAVEVFNIIKAKYPNSQAGREIDKYLARLGEYK